MEGPKVVWIEVDLAQLCHPLLFTSIDVSLYGGLASMDESGVPQTQAPETEEAGCTHEGFVEHQRPPCEDTDVLTMVFDVKMSCPITPPVVIELFKEDFKTKHHYEAAANDHEDHVEEEVSVVEVTNTIVEPGTVMVHLENAGPADTAVMCPRWLGRDALLADTRHLQKYSILSSQSVSVLIGQLYLL